MRIAITEALPRARCLLAALLRVAALAPLRRVRPHAAAAAAHLALAAAGVAATARAAALHERAAHELALLKRDAGGAAAEGLLLGAAWRDGGVRRGLLAGARAIARHLGGAPRKAVVAVRLQGGAAAVSYKACS